MLSNYALRSNQAVKEVRRMRSSALAAAIAVMMMWIFHGPEIQADNTGISGRGLAILNGMSQMQVICLRASHATMARNLLNLSFVQRYDLGHKNLYTYVFAGRNHRQKLTESCWHPKASCLERVAGPVRS
jgi:hypothetical protein